MDADDATRLLTAEWLSKANEDYRAAEILYETKLVMPALFHCQQAAEKAVKGFLCFHQQPLEKTHDITKLVTVAVACDKGWLPLMNEAALLTPLAVAFRYPGGIKAPDPAAVFAACRKVLLAVRSMLPASLFPSTWPKS